MMIDIDYLISSIEQLNKLLKNGSGRYHLNADGDLIRASKYRIKVSSEVKAIYKRQEPDRYITEIMDDLKKTESPPIKIANSKLNSELPLPRLNGLRMVEKERWFAVAVCGHEVKTWFFGIITSHHCIEPACRNYFKYGHSYPEVDPGPPPERPHNRPIDPSRPDLNMPDPEPVRKSI